MVDGILGTDTEKIVETYYFINPLLTKSDLNFGRRRYIVDNFQSVKVLERLEIKRVDSLSSILMDGVLGRPPLLTPTRPELYTVCCLTIRVFFLHSLPHESKFSTHWKIRITFPVELRIVDKIKGLRYHPFANLLKLYLVL